MNCACLKAFIVSSYCDLATEHVNQLHQICADFRTENNVLSLFSHHLGYAFEFSRIQRRRQTSFSDILFEGISERFVTTMCSLMTSAVLSIFEYTDITYSQTSDHRCYVNLKTLANHLHKNPSNFGPLRSLFLKNLHIRDCKTR